MNEGPNALACDDALEVALLEHVEDDHGQPVVSMTFRFLSSTSS